MGDDDDLYTPDERVPVTDGPVYYLFRCDQPVVGRRELEDRLARLFRVAWEQLPAHVKEVILTHWLPAPPRLAGHVVIKRQKPVGEVRTHARTEEGGYRIEFDDRSVKQLQLQDDILTGIIRHELAHVYANATGDRSHTVKVQTGEDLNEAERVVDRLLASWGLESNDTALYRWADMNQAMLEAD